MKKELDGISKRVARLEDHPKFQAGANKEAVKPRMSSEDIRRAMERQGIKPLPEMSHQEFCELLGAANERHRALDPARELTEGQRDEIRRDLDKQFIRDWRKKGWDEETLHRVFSFYSHGTGKPEMQEARVLEAR